MHYVMRNQKNQLYLGITNKPYTIGGSKEPLIFLFSLLQANHPYHDHADSPFADATHKPYFWSFLLFRDLGERILLVVKIFQIPE